MIGLLMLAAATATVPGAARDDLTCLEEAAFVMGMEKDLTEKRVKAASVFAFYLGRLSIRDDNAD